MSTVHLHQTILNFLSMDCFVQFAFEFDCFILLLESQKTKLISKVVGMYAVNANLQIRALIVISLSKPFPNWNF